MYYIIKKLIRKQKNNKKKQNKNKKKLQLIKIKLKSFLKRKPKNKSQLNQIMPQNKPNKLQNKDKLTRKKLESRKNMNTDMLFFLLCLTLRSSYY